MVLALVLAACNGEQAVPEEEPFSFVIYPGARYLGQVTETTKQAFRIVKPGEEPPPMAIYDTEAPVEEVAEYYAKQYGYQLAPEGAVAGETKPPAAWRTGELAADVQAIEPIIQQLGLQTDVSKASGTYRAADLEPLPHRPRVTIQRPYFDVTTSQVVDRTLILMSRG